MLFGSTVLSQDVTQGLKEKYTAALLLTEDINLLGPDVHKIVVIILIAEQKNSNSTDLWLKKTALLGKLVHAYLVT